MDAPTVYVNPDVQDVIRLHHDLFTDNFRRLSIKEQLEQQAQRIIQAHQLGNPVVATHVTCWHPRLAGCSRDEIMAAELTLEDARETIALEYGFDNWADAQARGGGPPNATFESAVDAVLAGDTSSLQELLAQSPELTRKSSDYGHESTLLHYVGCNGVETRRQVVPSNLAEIAQVLIDAGADVNATAGMYGGQCTPITLLITSAFPAEAGVVDGVVNVLLAAGAETDNTL